MLFTIGKSRVLLIFFLLHFAFNTIQKFNLLLYFLEIRFSKPINQNIMNCYQEEFLLKIC